MGARRLLDHGEEVPTMRTAILAGVLMLACPLVPATSRAADDPGKATYLRYCGACHGPDGKGDGIAGTFMNPKPIDLTQIAKKHGGEFPSMKVMEEIDGRTSVRAHGDPMMPVWGEIFADQAGWEPTQRTEVRGKLMAITDYLRSIQVK
jgi:mono/diheme cytochrome c family protein